MHLLQQHAHRLPFFDVGPNVSLDRVTARVEQYQLHLALAPQHSLVSHCESTLRATALYSRRHRVSQPDSWRCCLHL